MTCKLPPVSALGQPARASHPGRRNAAGADPGAASGAWGPPFQPDVYLDASGHINGIQGAILSEIARREGWVLHPEACEWAECLRLLRAGDVDVLPDVTLTPERVEVLGFHGTPVLFRSFQLFTRDGLVLDTMADLAGRRLAVLSGAAQQKMMQGALESSKHHLAQFACVACGFKENADLVGATNVLRAGYARLACEVSGAARPQQQEPPEVSPPIRAEHGRNLIPFRLQATSAPNGRGAAVAHRISEL